jgi:GTP-binding protein Era
VPEEFRSGIVAVVGRPNVGKSTLVNRMVGGKVAIVSDKPQTTRKRVLGIVNGSDFQLALVDTPGIHRPQHRMNAIMVRDALDAMAGADAVLFCADATVPPGGGERSIAKFLAETPRPTVAAINKIDKMSKPALLPRLEEYSRVADFSDIVPISAANGDGVDIVLGCLLRHLPEGPALYPADDWAPGDLAEKVAEQIREPALALTRDEVPFSLAVVVDQLEEDSARGLRIVYASIVVEREGQKGILVGKGGAMIREIGTTARLACEERFGGKFYLDLQVRTRERWREDDAFLTKIVNPEV